MIKIIVGVAENGVIGKDNCIPWTVPDALKFFKETTMGHILIMGRKTWDSLGRKPLPGRYNMVITRQRFDTSEYKDTMFADNLQTGIQLTRTLGQGNGFIIGGSQIYNEALRFCYADSAIVSHIKGSYDGDATFPIQHLETLNRTFIRSYNDFNVFEYDLR